MENLYFIIAGIVNGQICITEVTKAEPGLIDDGSLEILKRDGVITFGDSKFSMMTVVGPFGAIATIREFFILGLTSAGTDIEGQEGWFKKYCIHRYDNTIDILDKKNEDPYALKFPYTIGPT